MSRHRRRASQVLPPDILTGDEPPTAFDPNPSALNFPGQTAIGQAASVSEKDSESSKIRNHQDAPVTHCTTPGKKPPSGKATSN
ncbi:hypothetical protein Nepgr_014875 [Nepenthes gracilis]|uniref:Uncharacterized protein n=1 Tax=Nepenthes gracilis TaxID=150966 RepID=A0AAD3XQK2_NEPGR|nr:hypothetical protein Nepgr_014875 [Nepenthes gracilis]